MLKTSTATHLYNGTTKESEAYKWCDTGNTELSHTLPFSYETYNYFGGGHAISNYASADWETYGDYMSQLTVFKDIDLKDGCGSSIRKPYCK